MTERQLPLYKYMVGRCKKMLESNFNGYQIAIALGISTREAEELISNCRNAFRKK